MLHALVQANLAILGIPLLLVQKVQEIVQFQLLHIVLIPYLIVIQQVVLVLVTRLRLVTYVQRRVF